jgi:anion-transporting  ArsA/GET3 family ATPase
MNSLLSSAKVIVCVGSGGVGKTTVASALAYQAARSGRKVLVLTVDPSRRLKSTMGLDDKEESQIKLDSGTGQLWAAIINPKQVFDDFVLRFAKDDESLKKILNNRLYIQLSTTLSGSQEFTALEKLYTSFESQKYDLIVLDTPPTQHAIDFLEAPQKLAAMFNEKITKWFRDPSSAKPGIMGRIFQQGTQQVLKVLEKLTGSEFISELADFFSRIQKKQKDLEARVVGAHQLLVDPNTHFVLVTSFDEAKLKEAQYFSKEIRRGGYQLSTIFINRAYPKGVDLSYSPIQKNQVTQLYEKYQTWLRDKQALYQEFSIQMSRDGRVIQLPELLENVSNLDGVEEMANTIRDLL